MHIGHGASSNKRSKMMSATAIMKIQPTTIIKFSLRAEGSKKDIYSNSLLVSDRPYVIVLQLVGKLIKVRSSRRNKALVPDKIFESPVASPAAMPSRNPQHLRRGFFGLIAERCFRRRFPKSAHRHI